MMRLKVLLAYDGTAYSGWQIQEKADAPPTIQGAVEAALFVLLKTKVRVFGSGRTDAGVHALGQVAHFDIECTPANASRDWRHTLNALLPEDIRILSAERAGGNFDARKSAIAKTYIYNFWQERAFLPPYLRHYVWACAPLDIGAMRQAVDRLLGWHDFASFQNAGTPIRDTRREITAIEIDCQPPEQFLPAHRPLVRMSITASGFLKQMVRNIAGYAFYASCGKIQPERTREILQACDRRVLPSPTAPARGLALARVHYPGD